MSINEVKNYYPLRFVNPKQPPLKQPIPSEPLAHQPDYYNRCQHDTYITPHFKRVTVPPPSERPDSRNKSQNPQDKQQPRNLHDDYLVILENMDKRIKELMREAAGLMSMVLQQWNNIQFDEKIQEKLRLTDGNEIQKEYKALKDKLAVLRRQSIIQGTHQKKYNPYLTVPNPQAFLQKTKKLQRQKVIDYHVNPGEWLRQQNNKRQSLSHQKDRSSNSRQKGINFVKENGHPLAFVTQSDHLHKRAQHYKHKSAKLQATLQALLKEKQQTDRINEQMSSELLQLRAEILSIKYQYQKMY